MSSLVITVDADSPVPPYGQIHAQIAQAVTDRRLVAGTKLPSVRKLAGDLGLAPGTVARAYRELERTGVVDTQGRAGTVVAAGPDPSRAEAARLASEYARRVGELRLTREEALALVAAALS